MIKKSNAYIASGYPEIVISPKSNFWELSNEDKLRELSLMFDECKRRITNEYEPSVKAKRKDYIPNHIRRAVYERDNYTCKHCGTKNRLSVDHIIPESKGGLSTYENLQTLCKPCNSRKGVK